MSLLLLIIFILFAFPDNFFESITIRFFLGITVSRFGAKAAGEVSTA
jgi:hypothetical protein